MSGGSVPGSSPNDATSVSASAKTSTAQAKPQQNQKRKQAPRASANIILSRPNTLPAAMSATAENLEVGGGPRIERGSSLAPSTTSQRSGSYQPAIQNAFEQINLQLRRVQEEAAAINSRTLSTRQRSSTERAASTTATTEDESLDQVRGVRPRKRRKRNRDQAQGAEQQAAEVVANVLGTTEDAVQGTRKRPRGATPEDAEEHEIAPETTRMGDLCEDRKWGKKSETEKEMAANWDEILRRRKEDAEQRIAAASMGSRRKRDKERIDQIEAEQAGTGMAAVVGLQIENGQIVVASREVDRRGHLSEMMQETHPSDVREDKDIYKRVLATTVGCRNPIAPGQTWDDESTELFYTGLKRFGTDFQMISAMIPKKTRKQVKLKYNVEERKNWTRVKKCLSMKEDVDLDDYAQRTGVTFASVSEVYKQMEEDEKRLREEDEQRRRDEGIISQGQDGDEEADVALPSIEAGGATEAAQEGTGVVAGVSGTNRQSTVASRVRSTTTARQTAQPVGKKKQPNKKNNANSKKSRQAANRNKDFEGVEERIGDITEVAMPTG